MTDNIDCGVTVKYVEATTEEKLLAFKQENEAEKKHFYDFYGDKPQVDYKNVPWRRY